VDTCALEREGVELCLLRGSHLRLARAECEKHVHSYEAVVRLGVRVRCQYKIVHLSFPALRPISAGYLVHGYDPWTATLIGLGAKMQPSGLYTGYPDFRASDYHCRTTHDSSTWISLDFLMMIFKPSLAYCKSPPKVWDLLGSLGLRDLQFSPADEPLDL
jgi:hypothetical protein